MPARSSVLGLRLLWRPLGFSLNKCVPMLYAYKLSLKVSSKCIHPNYYFYRFECFHRVFPHLSSAPCTYGHNYIFFAWDPPPEAVRRSSSPSLLPPACRDDHVTRRRCCCAPQSRGASIVSYYQFHRSPPPERRQHRRRRGTAAAGEEGERRHGGGGVHSEPRRARRARSRAVRRPVAVRRPRRGGSPSDPSSAAPGSGESTKRRSETVCCTGNPLFKFILFIEPKYCIHISGNTIFIIFLFISVGANC